jgi:putative membrane protein
MSWIRTAVSLIGFGFAIVQFFERLRQMSPASGAYFPEAPKYLGLSLIGCGIVALLISIWQYRWTVNYLRSGSFAPVAGLKEGMQSPVIAVAVLLVCIGLFASGAVLLHLV